MILLYPIFDSDLNGLKLDLTTLITFLIAAVALALMPGPDNIYVLTESLSRNAKRGISIALGLASGCLVHTTIVASGLAIVVKQNDWVFSSIKYLGAAYLFYLALMSLKEKPIQLDFKGSKSEAKPFYAGFFRGFVMNVLNPKVSIFFLAFFPQFVNKEGWPVVVQIYTLGTVFMLQAFVIFSIIAFLAGSFSSYLNQAKFWLITKWLKFVVLLALALSLFILK